LDFIEAPRVAGEPFELATDIGEAPTRTRFLAEGWRLVLPHELSADYTSYRSYVRASKGEFTVAKDQYVRLRTGWFSDRSACYLAAGRPVITQETGFSKFYGGHEGLLPFTTLEDIGEAVASIRADYARHSRAARTVAAEFFAAECVLADLIDAAGA
jgi:hypothetical protein